MLLFFPTFCGFFETDRGAIRLTKQQQFQGTKYTYELVDVVASGVYRLLVVLCRSGQLFVCDSSGEIVNSLGAPVKKIGNKPPVESEVTIATRRRAKMLKKSDALHVLIAVVIWYLLGLMMGQYGLWKYGH